MDFITFGLSPRLKFINVMILSLSFMLLFTGFQTCQMVEETVLNSFINETRINGTSTFKGDGYTSLAILYMIFAFANWLAPSVVSILGAKYTMVVGGLTYVLYIATFIQPLTATLYTASILIGFGAAILWTGQGTFLTMNSSKETMGRNSGLFWALSQTSYLIGNIYVFEAWRGVTSIGDDQRKPLFIGLTAVSLLGVLLLLTLRTKPRTQSVEDDPAQDYDDLDVLISQQSSNVDNSQSAENDTSLRGALNAFLKSVRLFKTKEMLLLSITFFYTGLELTFFTGVYTTCVGATKAFGNESDRLVGLTGIMIGVGEIFGGLIFGIFGKMANKYGRDTIILLGGVLHLITFFLVFLNIPNDAPIAEATEGHGFISPNSNLAVACGFLLGFSDACFNTQMYSLIGSSYPDDSAPAFALYKFQQSLAAGVGFFYSSHLSLKWQLMILVVFDFFGILTFFQVEAILRKKEQSAITDNQ